MKHFAIIALFLITFTAHATDEKHWSGLMKGEEVTWQVLNLVDALETIDMKHHKHLHEGTFSECMGSAEIIGRHPNDATIVAWMATEGAVHFLVSDFLVRKDAPKWLQQTWQVVTITGKASVVNNNYQLGLRIKF